MIRDQKLHVTTCRDLPSSKTKENRNPSVFKHAACELESNKSAVNNHTLISFNSFSKYSPGSDESGSADFLPSPGFDELQTRIFSASRNLQMIRFDESFQPEQQNPPSRDRSAEVLERKIFDVKISNNGRGPSGPRPVVANNVRRQSLSTRQSDISSTGSVASGSMDLPSTLGAPNRRHSQPLNPAGGASGSTTRASKKSVGPHFIDSHSSQQSSRRRPSTTIANLGQGELGSTTTKMQVENAGYSRGFSAARAAKAKSFQPPSKNGRTLHVTENIDHQNTIPLADKFHTRTNEKGIAWLSSARNRISVVPGMPSPSHPTGLGARTVSPTDTRRAKRMSNMQLPSAMPDTPPTPPSDSARNRRSPSPSTIPTKVHTPSSSGNSPDPNRRCYSSRLSPSSAPCFHSYKDSTGSLQSRSLRPVSSSRLPTSKPRNLYTSVENERQEGECVPPVPAIPKAFESPKEGSIDPTSFTKKKSNLLVESNHTPDILTSSLYEGYSRQDSQDNLKVSRPEQIGSLDFNPEPDLDTNYGKKKLQPLRLPPMNLRPLSTTTTSKLEAYKELKTVEDQLSSKISQDSPFTASKTSFFGNNSAAGKLVGSPSHSRSNSALRIPTSGSTLNMSVVSKPNSTNRDTRSGFPPVSSSIQPKKGGAAYGCLPRTRTSDDTASDRSLDQRRLSTRNGPRTLNLNVRGSIRETPPAQPSNSDEPSTPLSASSLRRKLSLGWRRSASKSSVNFYNANEREPGYPSVIKKDDNTSPSHYPPPSTTISNLGSENLPSPSLSVKSTTYFDFKRRKSSVSSMSMFGGFHDRTISDSWGVSNNSAHGSKSKSKSSHSVITPRTSSMMHKKLISKEVTSPARPIDYWTVDLDRDDLTAEDEMKKLASKRKETESAARNLNALTERATAKAPISPQEAILNNNLNIFERGEIVDYKEVYFCGTTEAIKHVGNFPDDKQNFGYDDDRGDYKIIPGDHIYYRYEIIDLLGKGSFGQVVRCVDHKTGGLVAVKIIRNKKRFHQQALVEVNILKKLREWDPNGSYNMIRFTQSFYFRRHLCISAELLDMNLYELIKSNSFRGFSLKIVRRFTKQILNSLLLLQQHKVIHCDLKPENVLLTHPLHTEIKVIDFGSSCFENEKVYTYIQSRFYRSPEVILGMTYGMPIDIWSLGCIMAELYSGVPIFPGENEQEQLACIMEVFGPPEKHLIEKSTRRKVFFDSLGKPRLNLSSKGRRRRPSSKTLHQVLKCDDPAFLDFISKCLKWDPDRRMKPGDAIRHEFITGQKAPPPSVSYRHTSTIRAVSPIKRTSTTKSNLVTRPLPEPPTGPRTDIKNKSHEIYGGKGSPVKNSASVTSVSQKRQSAIHGNVSPQYGKRVVHTVSNNIGINKNALPRAARNTNAKIDAPNSASNFFPRSSSLIGISANNANSSMGARRGL